jgi:hypothetical protein
MNSSGKQLIAFWLHRRGENWTVQSVDKKTPPQVKTIILNVSDSR